MIHALQCFNRRDLILETMSLNPTMDDSKITFKSKKLKCELVYNEDEEVWYLNQESLNSFDPWSYSHPLLAKKGNMRATAKDAMKECFFASIKFDLCIALNMAWLATTDEDIKAWIMNMWPTIGLGLDEEGRFVKILKAPKTSRKKLKTYDRLVLSMKATSLLHKLNPEMKIPNLINKSPTKLDTKSKRKI